MGNTPSLQQRVHRDSTHHQEPVSGNFRPSQVKYLVEADKGRQSSITSQLFPSRKARHTHSPSGLGNIRRKTQNTVSHPPSLFKKNYSLGVASAGAQSPSDNGGDAHNKRVTRNGDPRDKTTSTENVRENMAGLSIKSTNDVGLKLFSPGPATPTVQPSREEAIPPMDDNLVFRNRQSVVALKKNLQESEQPSSRSDSSTNMDIGSNSVDIKKIKSPSQHQTDSAIATGFAAASNGRPSVDTDPESSDMDNISDDGYLQSKDVVLNQALLHNVIKRDMKRKRDKETSESTNNDTSNLIKKNLHEKTTVSNSKDSTLEPVSQGDNPISNEVMINLEPGSPSADTNPSYDSLELGHLPDVKKLKPISHDILLPHSAAIEKVHPNISQQHTKFYSMDSFEKGSVEHREVEDRNQDSLSSSPLSGSSSGESGVTQEVRVTIKWRDQLPKDDTSKMSMVSDDIASTFRFEKQKHNARSTFPMKYDNKNQEWVVPDLVLPAGIYRLQFLINGELRHSNYLPTATDSVGNFVNWFEVIPGYEEVEPYRDEVEIDSKQRNVADNAAITTSSLSLDNQGNHGSVLMEPVPGKFEGSRPPLTSMQHSSNRVLRSNTPYSDYTGISRSSSVLRKSPMHHTTSSLDLDTALQPKKYKYSDEIPELFKTTPISESINEDEDFTFGNMEPPTYDWTRQHPSGNRDYEAKVVDYNQDELFRELQQGGLLDAETAEQLFLEKYPVPDLPIYLNSYYLNKILSEFQKNNYTSGSGSSGINHIIPHVNLNHLLTSSIRDEMISVGCTTRYEGKFITQVIYAPCYYENGRSLN